MIRHRNVPASAVAIEVEVPFHDVDLLRVVWHGHYCKYLEIARTALLRTRDLDAAHVFELGFRFFVAETHLRHVAPLHYGDRLRVAAWFKDVDNRLNVAYDLVNLTTARRCGQGSTVLVVTDAAGTLCLETPAPILSRLRAPGPGQAA
jgi:acyl-CoA thioester hydrolase